MQRDSSTAQAEAGIIVWFVLVMRAILMPAWATHAWTGPSAPKSPAWSCSCRGSCLAGKQSLQSGAAFSGFLQDLPIPLAVVPIYFIFFSCISEVILVAKEKMVCLPRAWWQLSECTSTAGWAAVADPELSQFSSAQFPIIPPHTDSQRALPLLGEALRDLCLSSVYPHCSPCPGSLTPPFSPSLLTKNKPRLRPMHETIW